MSDEAKRLLRMECLGWNAAIELCARQFDRHSASILTGAEIAAALRAAKRSDSGLSDLALGVFDASHV